MQKIFSSGSGAENVPKSRLLFIPPNSESLNCCRNPKCDNFLVPPEFPDEPVPRGRVRKKNRLYSRVGHQRGIRLKCNGCGETLPIKSQIGFEEELYRLQHHPQIKSGIDSCPNTGCENHHIDISAGKTHYYKHGKNKAGTPRFKCKLCQKTFAVNTNPLQRQRITHLNKIVFKLLVNKSPTRRILEITDLTPQTLYRKIDFIFKQCILFSRNKEAELKSLLNGRNLRLATDVQYHLVNWTMKKDKRNTQLLAIATACNDTGYILGNHLNYDSSINQQQVEEMVFENNEYGDERSFRKTARYWTHGDYIKAAGRIRYDSKQYTTASTVNTIENTYSEALKRDNIDDSYGMDDFLKLPEKGVLIHSDYTMLAHFRYINDLTLEAKKVIHSMDQDSGMRAAFMLGYQESLKDRSQRRVDGFYVSFQKDLTVDAKRQLYRESESFIENQANEQGLSPKEVIFQITSENIQNALELGKWNDRWVRIPVPSMGEPEKMVCHLNDCGQHSMEKLPWRYLNASLHSVDRYFMQVRRMIHYLERPVKSATSAGNMWNGYSAYNPEMIEKLLAIFRVYYNFCKKGDDGMTPAQRIGLSKGVNDIEDILYFHPNKNLVRNL